MASLASAGGIHRLSVESLLAITRPMLEWQRACNMAEMNKGGYQYRRTKKKRLNLELDGHPLGGCGSGFGLVPGYTTLSVRVRANT